MQSAARSGTGRRTVWGEVLESEKQPSQSALVGDRQTNLHRQLLFWGLFYSLAFVLRSGCALARLFADGHHYAGGSRRAEV